MSSPLPAIAIILSTDRCRHFHFHCCLLVVTGLVLASLLAITNNDDCGLLPYHGNRGCDASQLQQHPGSCQLTGIQAPQSVLAVLSQRHHSPNHQAPRGCKEWTDLWVCATLLGHEHKHQSSIPWTRHGKGRNIRFCGLNGRNNMNTSRNLWPTKLRRWHRHRCVCCVVDVVVTVIDIEDLLWMWTSSLL